MHVYVVLCCSSRFSTPPRPGARYYSALLTEGWQRLVLFKVGERLRGEISQTHHCYRCFAWYSKTSLISLQQVHPILQSSHEVEFHAGPEPRSLETNPLATAYSTLVAMAFVPSSFLFLVVRPGAPSSVLAPSSVALCS